MQLERHYDWRKLIPDSRGNASLKLGGEKLANMTKDSIQYV
jgi:hypothetical protein